MTSEAEVHGGLTVEDAQLTAIEYRLLVEHSPVMIWRADVNKKCDYFNPVWLAFTGRTMEQELGDGWADGVHPDDFERCLNIYISSFDRRVPFEMEYRLRRFDGVYRWIFDRGVPYTDGRGEFLGYIGSCVDVTERRDAEQRGRDLAAERAAHEEAEKKKTELEEINAQLERAVADTERARAATEEAFRELDQFAYVASHDLRAPLRGIANLAQWVQDDAADKLPPESAEHLRILQGRVRRMEALIDGILEYSRAGRRLTATETLDTNEVVREVIQLLAPPDGTTMVVQEGLPTLVAERVPLQQVFLNLIGNAIKYTSAARADPFIRVTCRESSEACEFAVADNGPGIAPEYHDRIWGVFQTLEARDKVEGTGIGLSVVKKIVESRGGRVSIDSAPGNGATFRFSWPRKPGSGSA